MNISEMIAKLKTIQKQHGDLPVLINHDHGSELVITAEAMLFHEKSGEILIDPIKAAEVDKSYGDFSKRLAKKKLIKACVLADFECTDFMPPKRGDL